MALTEAEREALLQDLNLLPDGERLTLAPSPTETVPIPVSTPVQAVDVEALTDEQLLDPGAFDTYKLSASQVGRAISSPHNKRLYARIQDARNRLRDAEQAAKRDAKAARKAEHRTHIKDMVRQATVDEVVEAVLARLEDKP